MDAKRYLLRPSYAMTGTDMQTSYAMSGTGGTSAAAAGTKLPVQNATTLPGLKTTRTKALVKSSTFQQRSEPVSRAFSVYADEILPFMEVALPFKFMEAMLPFLQTLLPFMEIVMPFWGSKLIFPGGGGLRMERMWSGRTERPRTARSEKMAFTNCF